MKTGRDPMTRSDVDLALIEEARGRIARSVTRTPLKRSRTLSDRLGCNVYVKFELFQKTGSFKPRGAFNKLLSLSAEQRRRGAVAVSGGNHGQAVAFAAHSLGLPSKVFMPENTPSNYVDAARGYGAEVLLRPDIAKAFEEGASLGAQGYAFVHPFDDPLVIAGQGTVGLEIHEDVPRLTDAVVSIGGGGFIGGIATALKARNPAVRVWGVETEGADAMAQALGRHGFQVTTDTRMRSVAESVGSPVRLRRTLDITRITVADG